MSNDNEDVKCPRCGCYKTEAVNGFWRRCKTCAHVFERRVQPCPRLEQSSDLLEKEK